MLLRSGLDLISKYLILPRPLIAVTSPWFSTSTSFPPPPKRSKTSWQLYFTEYYPVLVKENPGLPRQDLFKKLTENWKKLDKSILDKYQKISDESKKKYQEEIEIYRANLTAADKLAIAEHKASRKIKGKPSQKKQLKALGMPKRPPSSYILFAMDYSKKHFSEGYLAIRESPKIAAAWAQLSEGEKSKWTEMAAAEKREYKKNLMEWEQKMISEGNLEIIHTKSKSK